MQSQGLFSYLPKELLFPCVTGYSNPSNRMAIRNLIDSRIQLKLTCQYLNQKVNECWKTSLEALWEDWKTSSVLGNMTKAQFVILLNPSFRLLLNWIDGQPEITRRTLRDTLKYGFYLGLKPADELRLFEISNSPHNSIPTFWTSQPNQNTIAFTRSTPFGDATFINIKTGTFLGEILGEFRDVLIFEEKIQPIFYKNCVIILFQKRAGPYEIGLYEIEESKLSLIKKTSIPQTSINSMYLFKDHLVFQAKEEGYYRIEAVLIEDLKSSKVPTFLQSKLLWPSNSRLEVINDKVMIFSDGKGISCQTMHIAKGKLEFNDHQVKGNRIGFYVYGRFSPTFYYNDNYAFFLFYDLGRHTIGAISNEELNSSHGSLCPFLSPPQEGFAKLVQFNDSVILCSGKMGNPLKFQTLEVTEGEIETTPLEIFGSQDCKFNRLDNVYSHLDKLFLVGVLAKDAKLDIPEPDNYLVIVNMETKRIENKFLLNLDIHPKIIATGLGCLYVFNPTKNNILQIKY